MNELQFLETDRFTKWVRKAKLRSDVERLKDELQENSDAGDVISGGGGLRKVRMAGAGRGKQGGFRVIYVLMVNRTVAVLMDGYSKSDQEDLTAVELAALVVRAEEVRPAAEQLARNASGPEG